MSKDIKEMKYPLVSIRLKDALRDKNMSAQDLADRTGIGKSSISHYINGTHCPNNLTSIRLANALGVNAEWIMGYEQAVKKSPIHLEKQEFVLNDQTMLLLHELKGRGAYREMLDVYVNLMDEKQIRKLISFAKWIVKMGDEDELL